MPRYEENKPRVVFAVLALFILFVLLYAPWRLGDRELCWQEGYFAAQASEVESYFMPLVLAHGMAIQTSFPFYPLCASFCYNELHLPMEFVLRIISVIAIAVLSVVTWFAARTTSGVQAACVAASVMFGSLLMLDKGIEGHPHTLMLVFLAAGWFSWFTLGAGRGQWSRAWISALFFCGMAFYTGGFVALLYFIFPLIFMRRPLTIWSKMNKPGFYIGMAVLVGFILLWALPLIILEKNLPFFPVLFEPDSITAYLMHLYQFPIDVFIKLMPWSVLAWAPFCVALHPLDNTPIFSRFLRIIVISLFMLLWLSPFTDTRDIMIIIPPLAVLTGNNYAIVIRRYGDKLFSLCKLVSFPLCILGASILFFYTIPGEWWNSITISGNKLGFRYEHKNIITGIVYGIIAILAGLILIQAKIKPYIWLYILMLTTGVMIFFWTIIYPFKCQDETKHAIGNELKQLLERERVAANEIIYKDITTGMYGECFYIGVKIRRINSNDEIPSDKKIVYLISTEFPLAPERRWRNLLSERKMYKDKRICLWQGIKNEQKKKRNEFN
jgi:hypothetical protein